MEKQSAIIFIDGNNWYHNVKSVVAKPGRVDLSKLAYFICSKLNLELIEIVYYNSIPDIQDGEAIYYQHMSFLSELEKEGIKVKTRKLQKISNAELKKEREIFIEALDLCASCKPIVKESFLEVIGNYKKKEKGIDVMIAIDMIKQSVIDNRCNKCILISGDADFIPAMQIIKDAGKEAITCCVPYGHSRELRGGKFRYFIIKKRDLIEKCMKEYKEMKKEENKNPNP